MMVSRLVTGWIISLGLVGWYGRTRCLSVGVFSDQVSLARRALSQLDSKIGLKVEPLVESGERGEIDRLRTVFNQIRRQSVDVVVGRFDHVTAMVLDKLEIPYLVTSRWVETEAQGTFEMRPYPEDVGDVLVDILRRYNRTEIGVIYDHTLDYRILTHVIEARHLDSKFWKLGTGRNSEMRQMLIDSRDKMVTCLLLLTTPANSQKLLLQARRLGLINAANDWLVLNLDSADVSQGILDDILTNVMTVNLVRPPSSLRHEEDALRLALVSDALTSVVTAWSTLTGTSGTLDKFDNIGANITRQLYNMTFEGHTGLVAFDQLGKRRNISFDITKFDQNSFVKIGEWGSLADVPEERLKIYTFSNVTRASPFPLRGRTVPVVTILEAPFTTLVEDHEQKTGNARFEGFAVDLMNEIADMLKFKYELYVVPDGKFGSKTETGEWNGLVGEVLSGNATISLAPLSINADRENVIDFTKPFKTRAISVLMRTPQSLPSYFQFLKPLSTEVWICTILAVATVSLLLWALERYSARRPLPDHPTMGVRESCWFVFGSLVQGGTDSSPVTMAGRILTSVWWLFALMMVSTYTANLAAFLTVKKIQPPISSVTDLAGQTAIKFGTVRNSGVETFFTNTKIPAFVEMRTHMTELFDDAMVNTTLEGLRRVREEDYAFLWDNTVTAYVASKDCDYTEIGPSFDPKGFGLAVPPGATYREDLSLAILRLGDQGKIVELEHKYWMSGKCADGEKPGADQTSELQVENVAGIFFILIAGVVGALTTCVINIIYNKRRRSK